MLQNQSSWQGYVQGLIDSSEGLGSRFMLEEKAFLVYLCWMQDVIFPPVSDYCHYLQNEQRSHIAPTVMESSIN